MPEPKCTREERSGGAVPPDRAGERATCKLPGRREQGVVKREALRVGLLFLGIVLVAPRVF